MKYFLALFILLGSVSLSNTFSQDKIFEAKVVNPAQFNESKTNGVFEFQFPTVTNKEVFMKNAAFYVNYFTVDFNTETTIAKITMLTNDAATRQFINRFMISNKISQIEMAGQLFKVSEFYEKKLK